MSIATKLIAIIGAPALLAGFILAGSASSSPSVSVGQQYATVKFTAGVIFGTTTYTIDSTSCTLNLTQAGKTVSCMLTGTGGLNNQGKIATANLAITSKKGPISLSLSGLHSCLGVGSGAAVTPSGPIPVVAHTAEWTTAATVIGNIKVYEPGSNVVTC